MNEDKPFLENQIISKKMQKIDQDEHHGKKGKKNKKNRQQQSIVDVEEKHEGSEKDKPGGKMTQPTNHQKKNDQKIFTDLCSLLPDYKQGTILKVLQQTNFNKEEAYAKLLLDVPDNEKQSEWMKDIQKIEKSSKKQEDISTASAPSENANVLMNEVFDTLLKEEINGRQFEELFEEISEMIKEDQKEQGVGIMEINSFVDECKSIKQTLLVGFREQLSNFDDFDIDSRSDLYEKIQQFVEDIILKQIKQEKKMEEDYPSLDGGYGKKSIVEKIKQENKKKKEEESYFTPSRNTLPTFAREKHNEMSLFNVDNKLTSQKDLMSLHEEFIDVPIIDLKFIYKALAGDYNRTVEFLCKHYDQKTSKKVVRQIRTIHYSQPKNPKKQVKGKVEEEKMDEEFEKISLEELRDEIDHLFKLKQAFMITKMKINSTNQRRELDRICNQNEPLLRRLCQAARIKAVQAMQMNNPLYIDLHGWRQEEIDELMNSIHRMIQDLGNKGTHCEYSGSEKVKTKQVGGKRTTCLVMLTGKGTHSKGRRSVLKPAIADWCDDKNIRYEEDYDNMKVYIVIN